jgi:hypoxanthine phosphoribosyltransferase
MADGIPSEEAREVLDWATYGVAIRELAAQVANSGFKPDMILAIARGGLFAAGSLGYALSVKNLYVMNLEFYAGVDDRMQMPVMLPPYMDKVDLTDAKILVADDVADTGHTLKAVHEFCQDVVAESRTAVLYEKSHSLVKCDYIWKKTDRWINFPWSTAPPLVQPDHGNIVLDA